MIFASVVLVICWIWTEETNIICVNKEKSEAANRRRVLLDVLFGEMFGGSDTRAARRSPCRGSCRCPFPCSAFISLQVNIVTELGVKLDLQITQHLLDGWHSSLETFDLLLQCFLLTQHKSSLHGDHYMRHSNTYWMQEEDWMCIIRCTEKHTTSVLYTRTEL